MKKVIVGIVVVLVLVVIFSKGSNLLGSRQEVSLVGPVDTAGDFYNGWLDAIQAPEEAELNLATLAKAPILSKELRIKIKDALRDSEALDPVLCHEASSEGIALRTVYEREDSAKMLVTSRDKSIDSQSVMTLKALEDGWYIDEIECLAGEFAPEEREFSFEQEGSLLKDSIPPPYDSKDWHLVFEEDEVKGNVVPIFFDSESQCLDADGHKDVCQPDKFTEADRVFIQGQMSERGVIVKLQESVE